MLYESFDDDNKIRKMLRRRLWEISRTETQSYDPEEDDDADNKMNTVVNLLQTANTDLYNIVFTINEREPAETKVNVEPPEPPSGAVPMEPLIASTEPIVEPTVEEPEEQQPEEEQQSEEEPDLTIDEIKDLIKTIRKANGKLKTAIKNGTQRLQDLERQIINKQASIDKIQIEQMSKPTATNDAKLDRALEAVAKWEAEGTKLEEKVTEMADELKEGEEQLAVLQAMLQSPPVEYEATQATEEPEATEEAEVTGSGPKPRKGTKKVAKEVSKRVPNYRSVNLYVNFAQYVLNLTKNLYKANQIFQDGLIYHYDYVEPGTMQEYYKAYDELQKMYKNFLTLTYVNGAFKITLKGTAYNQVEKVQLTEKVQALIDEEDGDDEDPDDISQEDIDELVDVL
jgi:NADH dehydrogenase/NADH:ubiquinone oxidoreductase subunit G